MRIVKEKTLKEYCNLSRYKKAEFAIRSWIYEVRFSNWNNSSELKVKYSSASIISSKRVVFNIKGNDYRLVVDVEYKLKIVFIVWFGSHDEYDNIDVKRVSYESQSDKDRK
jgi:mRNA interferase HigB